MSSPQVPSEEWHCSYCRDSQEKLAKVEQKKNEYLVGIESCRRGDLETALMKRFAEYKYGKGSPNTWNSVKYSFFPHKSCFYFIYIWNP